MRVKTQARRDAIVEVASRAFMELGFERTSMAEISARLGGSKATLYGYFSSKEELFIEVARSVAETHIQPAFHALVHSIDGDEAAALQRFGESFLGFIVQPDAVAIQRMVVAESGHSTIGQLFFESGPKKGHLAVASFIQAAMSRGRLHSADPAVAAEHLMALLQAEMMQRLMFGVAVNTSKARIRKAVERTITAFMLAYGPER
jgi:AcrR family transcriptional regulator